MFAIHDFIYYRPICVMTVQPRSQGLCSSCPQERPGGGEKREPGNEGDNDIECFTKKVYFISYFLTDWPKHYQRSAEILAAFC